jgi:amidase
MRDTTFATIRDAARALEDGRTTSEALTQAVLSRADALDGELHSFAHRMPETALAAARRADEELRRGYRRGPLHGVPLAVKDLVATADAPTRSGGVALAAPLAEGDATVAARLRRAGAVIVGKTQMTEGATIAHHPEVAPPRNPWDRDRCSGFSSSGSGVAVAAGLAFAALGSDTGGSIRIPSSVNGVSGIKPTWGRVSRHGVFPLIERLDTIGPLARSAADLALVLGTIAGRDPADPTCSHAPVPAYLEGIADGIDGLTVGVDWRLIEASCDAATVAMLRTAADDFAGLGARLRTVEMPSVDMALLQPVLDAAVLHAHRETWPAKADAYGPGLAGLLQHATRHAPVDMIASLHAGDALRARFLALLDEVDVVLAPVLTMATPRAGWFEAQLAQDPAAVMSALRFTSCVNIAGLPSIALPGGFDGDGAPLGFQLIGRAFGEAVLFRAGFAHETATDWHTRHPGL